MSGLRSDPYAAVLELFVGCPLLAYGAFELSEAIREAEFLHNDPRTFMVPDEKMIFDAHASAAVHYVPALVLVALTLFVRRRDPYTRPLVASLFALAVGVAHINSVMSIFTFGAPLGPIGVLGIAFSLRPNRPYALLATIFAALLLPYAAMRLDVTLHRVLLGSIRGRPVPFDLGELGHAALAWLVGAILVGVALTLRVGAPGRAVRLRLVVVAGWGLPVCAGVYTLLARLGLPLDA